MNVDIHRARIDIELEYIGRSAISVQQFPIRLARGVPQQAVAYETAIDEEVLRVGARARALGRAGEAAQMQVAGPCIETQA